MSNEDRNHIEENMNSTIALFDCATDKSKNPSGSVLANQPNSSKKLKFRHVININSGTTIIMINSGGGQADPKERFHEMRIFCLKMTKNMHQLV